MAKIRVHNSIVDTSGAYEREQLLSMSYDGRIPERERAVARYGSPLAAQLVDADVRLRVARQEVGKVIERVRSWEARPEGYAPDVIDRQIASTRKDLEGARQYYRACQDYLGKVESAYQQAFGAGVVATRA